MSFDDENREMERMLSRYYRATRASVDPHAKAAVADAAAAQVCSDQVRTGREARRGFVTNLAFVADQARFMGATAWAAQAGVAAAVLLLSWFGHFADAAGVFACLAGAAVAVCALPSVLASRSFGLVELERSCFRDAREVALARMVVLACANAVAIAVVLALMPKGALGGARMLLFAFAPYFLTVAGCLFAARRINGPLAAVTAAAWGAIVVLAAWQLNIWMPEAYAQGSAWLWGLALAGAAVWAVAEARSWLEVVSRSASVLSFEHFREIGR